MHKPRSPSLEHSQARSSPYFVGLKQNSNDQILQFPQTSLRPACFCQVVPLFVRPKQHGPNASLPTYFAETLIFLPGRPLILSGQNSTDQMLHFPHTSLRPPFFCQVVPLFLLSKQGIVLRRVVAKTMPELFSCFFDCCHSHGCGDSCKWETLKLAAGQGARASARSFFFL